MKSEDASLKYLNLPMLLARRVWVSDANLPEGGFFDASWKKGFRQRIFALVSFFQENNLVNRALVRSISDIDELIVTYEDFTDAGRKFINSGADDRWLESFDRVKNRSNDDVTYLEKRLKEMLTK